MAPTEGAQSIRRAVAVLRVLASSQERGVRISEISRELSLNRSTVHRMLRVLVEERLAEQDVASGFYALGPEASLFGLARKTSLRLSRQADPFLRAVSLQTGDSAFLTIRSGLDSVCVARTTGTHPVQVLSVDLGARRPLGLGVGGQILLHALGEEQKSDVIRANESRLAAVGISRRRLNDRLASIQERGYAYAPVGIVPATSAVAVAVTDGGGAVVAALSVATISSRLRVPRMREVVRVMREQSALFSNTLRAPRGDR